MEGALSHCNGIIGLGSKWNRMKVMFRLDNQAVVECIKSGTSCCPHMMTLLRNLFLIAARGNFSISATHIPGVHNVIADALSRFHMQAFHNLAPTAASSPTHSQPLYP